MNQNKQRVSDLAISTPEVFYNRLKEPQNPSLKIAREGLEKILELSPRDGYRHVEWWDISNGLIKASDVSINETRSLVAISNRVIRVMREYPWLQSFGRHSKAGAPINLKDLDVWASNHVFDDFPGLFGITEHEGHVFSGAFHGKNQPEAVKIIAEDLSIQND